MEQRPSGRRSPVALLAVGSEMAAATVGGLLLDYVLGTLPVFTAVLTVVGAVSAFVLLVQLTPPRRNANGDATNGSDRVTDGPGHAADGHNRSADRPSQPEGPPP